MNRKNLTAAVLAGLAGAAGIVGSAQAVNVNPDGLGELLLYPYYTTNGGNQTALSVVNTSENAKAVKVRFLEGQNSREVLDFNMYMSAYDVWTAAIYDDAGTPTLVTHDTTCTVPYLYMQDGGKQPFLPWALNDKMWQEDGETYDDITRATEGHFEMIEMGTIIDEETTDASGNTVPVNGSAAAATHKDGVPANCEQLVKAWTRGATAKDDGYWITDPFADMSAPSGGLFGGAAIINVAAGTMYSYDAKAINGFADPALYGMANPTDADALHQEPGTILPSLDSGGQKTATIFANDGTTMSSTLARGVDAVSYVFMHDQIMNEYTTEAVVNAGTEWVVTFPTKQFYVHQFGLDNLADYRDDLMLNDSVLASPFTAPVAPFTTEWFWTDSTKDKDGFLTEPCEVVRLDTIWDREEGEPADAPPGDPRPPIVSPAPPDLPPNAIPFFSLCYETQIIRFAGEGAPEIEPHTDDMHMTEILGSANFTTIDNGALGNEFGWARLDLVDASSDSDGDGVIENLIRPPLGGLMGLPVTGFAVQQFQNGFLGEGSDTLANYGGIFTHKGTRSAAPTAPTP
jgi:hypothetical protein